MDHPAPHTPLRARLGARLTGWRSWARRLDAFKTGLVVLPFLCLAAYWLDLALPLPTFLLPERRYLALSRTTDLQTLRQRRDDFFVLPDRLVPAPRGEAAMKALREALPDEPSLGPVLRELAAGLKPFKRARLVSDRAPLASELEALQHAAGPVPLAIEVQPSPMAHAPLQALSVRQAPGDARVSFDLLLHPDARRLEAVEIRNRREVLHRSTGAALPEDLVLRLSVAREEAASLSARFRERGGREVVRTFAVSSELEEPPKVLVISDKKPLRSFVEAIYPCRRVSSVEAAALDLLAFELVVVDGVPLKRIRGPLLNGLLDLSARRTGSLLFVADDPAFGRKGDNPALEELLPVTLLPRSLKDLPDLAVLILVDVSGSMFGDKLSLAKVTGLELLRSLKPSDVVGMMLFSDERRWVYPFQPNANIKAAPVLEPLTAGGGTDLHPALTDGLARLAEQSIKAKHAVLITDGVTKPADFQALADRARRQGISISTMGVGDDANRPLLERLALQTDGRYYRVGSLDAIPGLLFEDRMSEARAIFGQGTIPVLAMNGERVAQVRGMAQYTPLPTASILFSSDVGDPLLAGREQGNRAVLFFGSDLYGTYTADFFAAPAAAGAFKDRLDALFAKRPAQVRVVETARGLSVHARSDSLVAPVLLLSRQDRPPLEVAFRRNDPQGWVAELSPPYHGMWNAAILDRGGSLASFPVAVNGGFAGVRSDAVAALEAHRLKPFRLIHLPAAWLLLFFASSLACTVLLRVKR